MDSVREIANKIHFDLMKVKENSIIVDGASNWFEYLKLIKSKERLIDILTKLKIKLERDNYLMENKYDQWITMSALIDGILDFVETGDEFQLSQLMESLHAKKYNSKQTTFDSL